MSWILCCPASVTPFPLGGTWDAPGLDSAQRGSNLKAIFRTSQLERAALVLGRPGPVSGVLLEKDPQSFESKERNHLFDGCTFLGDPSSQSSGGDDAGLLTERFNPTVILLDYMLPDINGNVVCDRVKSNPKTRDTRIIIVSGAVDRDEITGLLENGADDFIAKPFDPATLLGRVTELAGL